MIASCLLPFPNRAANPAGMPPEVALACPVSAKGRAGRDVPLC